MTRSELAARLAVLYPHLRLKEVEFVLSAIFGRIEEALTVGDRVELRDFGSFTVKRQEARLGRNPRTRAVVEIGDKAVIRFRPGKAIRDRLTGGCRTAHRSCDASGSIGAPRPRIEAKTP